jgi:hypothetical protein
MNPIAPPSEPGKPLKKSAGGRPKKLDASSDPSTHKDLKPISSVATGHQYFVSKGGAVYRKLKTGKMYELKPWYGGSPYKQVYLYRVAGVKNKYGRQKQYVHKLVADAFIPKEKGKEFVHHVNGVENQN